MKTKTYLKIIFKQYPKKQTKCMYWIAIAGSV